MKPKDQVILEPILIAIAINFFLKTTIAIDDCVHSIGIFLWQMLKQWACQGISGKVFQNTQIKRVRKTNKKSNYITKTELIGKIKTHFCNHGMEWLHAEGFISQVGRRKIGIWGSRQLP